MKTAPISTADQNDSVLILHILSINVIFSYCLIEQSDAVIEDSRIQYFVSTWIHCYFFCTYFITKNLICTVTFIIVMYSLKFTRRKSENRLYGKNADYVFILTQSYTHIIVAVWDSFFWCDMFVFVNLFSGRRRNWGTRGWNEKWAIPLLYTWSKSYEGVFLVLSLILLFFYYYVILLLFCYSSVVLISSVYKNEMAAWILSARLLVLPAWWSGLG